MIDIHSHILPGIDDGAINMEEAVEMAAMAAESGVKYMVATPHCNIPGVCDNYLDKRFIRNFKDFRQTIKEMQIPVQILPGMEIFATPELPTLLKEKKVLTLNGSKYFLVEFSFDEEFWLCSEILLKCRKTGFIPVIAHPERYECIQDKPEYAAEWIKNGYALQINKGSILGRFGRKAKRTADVLLQRRQASCVASDAHSAYRRTTHMKEIQEYLAYEYGEEYAQALLLKNPLKILKSMVL